MIQTCYSVFSSNLDWNTFGKASTQCHDQKDIKYRQGVEFNMPKDPHGNRQYATHKETHTKSNITYTDGYVNWPR